MTRPLSISVLCPSFARPERLQEAIRCFLDQDYSGPKQMLVLNTFPRQTLLGDFPNVRIINLPQRPPSLGTARNWACQTATGEILINLDDDDFMLPSCLRMYAEAFAESNADWVRFTPTFYAEAWQVKNTLAQWANSVAFRRSAWDRVGKYASHLSCGEDQNFFGRLSAQSQGLTVELAPHEIPMIYCWANQVYHLSGGGPDQPGNVTAYARALIDAEQRIAKGQCKTGDIPLTPGYEPGHDPRQMARHYLDQLPASPAKDSGDVCVIELGRYGDLINILPICRHIHLTYRKPFLMVSREFAPLLEGVSYVEPLIVPLKNDQLSEAIALAKKDFKLVLQAQAWGKGWHQEKKCESYNMESWRNAGFLHQFPDRSWRPVFDRRNPARESALVAKLKAPGKPLLLVNVTHSVSSPFQGERLLSLIRSEFGSAFEIVDLATTRFERLYDLLGVMEHSAALVCIDTAPLHLAAATNLPVVAITNSLPWQGTACRMPAKVIGYHEAFGNPALVISALREALTQPAPELPPLHTGLTIPRRIFHAVEQHEETDRAAELRKRRARYSWDQLYKRGVIPCPYGPYQRNARAIGCARDLPYLKDVLAHAMAKAHDHDIILWTNDDTVLHPQLVSRLQFQIAVYGPCMAMTCDIADEKFPSLNAPPEAFVALGQTHFGRDVFAFEKRWLAAHWAELPDFLIGASEFDNCLAAMIRRHYGIPTPWPSLAESIYPADLPKGLVAHVAHAAAWKQGPHLPEQRHNLGLLEKWAQEHCRSLRRRKAVNRKLFHAVERHSDPHPDERKETAWGSWDALYQQGVIPCHVWEFPRTADLSLSDPRPLPYLKDVLQSALDQADAEDIVFWTNDDNVLHPNLPNALQKHFLLFEVCSSQRCEFRADLPPLTLSPAQLSSAGEPHMGRDLFAATKQWWLSHWEDIPDFILGASDFDLCLASLIRLEYGITTTRVNIETSMFPAELSPGLVLHQHHAPRWNAPDNVNTAPSQLHNRALFKAFGEARLSSLHFTKDGTI